MKKINLKLIIISLIFISAPKVISAQELTLTSPNGKVKVELTNSMDQIDARWFLTVNYVDQGVTHEAIPRIDLGMVRSDQEFSDGLTFLRASKVKEIKDQYNVLHGKRLQRENRANEVVAQFENGSKAKMNVIIRAYDDGLAFQYNFPDKEGTYKIKEELTAYHIPDSTKRWLQKFNPANEGYYRDMKDGTVQQDWAYPALFHTSDTTTWYMVHEAGLGRDYCGTKLSNQSNSQQYKLVFPDDWNGRGQGDREPTISLPWKSPWRVVVVGSLSDIVESTLVDDVSPPSKLTNTEWIKPGLVSWNYWSHNHGTKDFQVVKQFADLAAKMDWPYTLIDWEWDAMSNGGDLDDALEYIHSIGVKPMIWYNSGGTHTWVEATPKDRMLTHENRVEEFTKLKEKGIVGVKVDFFESEKQDMINYYIDILEDAAEFEIMVYFHGCLVPRGWGRTYPHLMTYEGVRGAEWYNNGPDFTYEAPSHNTVMPFTRNVVGSMDYTPVTFTNSQFPHITSYGHELALGVLFESALQHLADRPEGFSNLPDAAKIMLRDLPTIWEDTKLLSGYPGTDATLARKSKDIWYVGGINGEDKRRKTNVKFDFLDDNLRYKLLIISDGAHDKDVKIQHQVINAQDSIDVNLLPRGGFVVKLEPLD